MQAKKLTRLLFAGAMTTVLLAVTPLGLAGPFDTDHPGARDHQVLSRFQGSTLYTFGEDSLASANFLFAEKGQPVLRGVEGRINNRMYYGPKGSSALEIYRNFKKAVEVAGFAILFSCEVEECQSKDVQSMVKELPRVAKWVKYDPYVSGIFNSGNQPGFHYLSARKSGPAGPVHLQVAISRSTEGGSESGRVRQFIQIVEPAKVSLDKVTVDAKGIGESLQRDGKIALYGVTFDTNSAVIRDDSTEQLGHMAKALKSTPSLMVLIVGHTDNQGGIDANLALSNKRAQAVTEALTKRHGIASSRLMARGVASFAPVSTNANETGRAMNRRVEMVVR